MGTQFKMWNKLNLRQGYSRKTIRKCVEIIFESVIFGCSECGACLILRYLKDKRKLPNKSDSKLKATKKQTKLRVGNKGGTLSEVFKL